jgi:hypothetical protein
MLINRNAIHTEEYKNYTIEIVPDDSDFSPRDWDNAGTMVTWHSRYSLGDKQPKENPETWLANLLKEETDFDSKEYNAIDDMVIDELLGKLEKFYIFLPVYLYDHSGISISTSRTYPYNDRWDAGQVGWIYISKKNAVNEWGKKLFTKVLEEKTIKHLQGEIKVYDDFLVGNVYGYRVLDADGEVVDSNWGYYPDDDDKTGYDECVREAKSIIDLDVREADDKKWEALQEQEAAQLEMSLEA